MRRRGEITSATANQHAQTDLMIKADILFEAKRIKYSFGGAKRKDILAEIEGYNARLQEFLASNDRVLRHTKVPAPRKLKSKFSTFGDTRQASFAHGRSAMIRQIVACEWLEEVQGEAGEDYASAVNGTLRQAPIVVKDDRWQGDLAGSVVQPLQRYYEYLNPKTSTP